MAPHIVTIVLDQKINNAIETFLQLAHGTLKWLFSLVIHIIFQGLIRGNLNSKTKYEINEKYCI